MEHLVPLDQMDDPDHVDRLEALEIRENPVTLDHPAAQDQEDPPDRQATEASKANQDQLVPWVTQVRSEREANAESRENLVYLERTGDQAFRVYEDHEENPAHRVHLVPWGHQVRQGEQDLEARGENRESVV